jgi:hypothetical protein
MQKWYDDRWYVPPHVLLASEILMSLRGNRQSFVSQISASFSTVFSGILDNATASRLTATRILSAAGLVDWSDEVVIGSIVGMPPYREN